MDSDHAMKAESHQIVRICCLRKVLPKRTMQAMAPRSPLDNPLNSAHAWARYRRLMVFMGVFTVSLVIIALTVLYWKIGMVSIHFYIATALGITVAMLLMAALMGLVFLSSGTGHDEAVADRHEDE